MLKAGAQSLGNVALNGASLFSAGWNAATQPWIVLGLCLYFVSAGLWILALTKVDVTVAYPMLSMGYVIAAVLAWHFFGEALTASRLLGITIILVGVVVLARG
jgi:multidrug transporter EmrE-like cation transporter